MSRVFILLLLLALWIFIGIYFWPKIPILHSDKASSDPCVISWELKDIGVKSDASINFTKSSANMDELDSGISQAIDKISKYLKDNKGKNVTIIGYHDLTESFEPSLYDLSLARANAVKSMLLKKGAPANQLHVLAKQYKDEDKSRCLQGNRLNRGASFAMGRLTK